MLSINSAELLWDVFCYGVDYGQLTMERERENEELFDAFCCYNTARKTAMPSEYAPRRHVHSDKWIEAKQKSYSKFLEIYGKYKEMELQQC